MADLNCGRTSLAGPAIAPGFSTGATGRVHFYWCSMLRAQIRRVCAVAGSLTCPIASRCSSVTCAAAICRCRAEDSALGTAEVRFPTKQGYSQLRYDVGQTVASGAAGQFPDAVFEFVDGFVRHLQPGSVPADRKSQKLAFGWAIYRAFQRIHCESQRVADEACHAGHHPLARCFAFDHDVAVVGVMGKAVAAPFQLPVELIQYDIRQHRRQRAALRYALCRGLYTAVHTDSGLEIAVDEAQQGRVIGALFEPHHEPIVIDAIKERFDVGVHHPGIICADIRLDLSHGLMCRASRAEPVTAGVEVGFPFGADDLRDGLLDESVDHGRDTQGPFLAVGFGDLHALYRLRAAGASNQLGADFRPMLLEVVGQFIDAHAVDARRAFVPAHLLQGTSQVLPVQDLGEQRAGRNRLGLEGKTRYFLA